MDCTEKSETAVIKCEKAVPVIVLAGAGRKPDYFKRLGIKPDTAADILAHHDEPQMWNWLLTHAPAPLRFKALAYLTDRRDGRAEASR
jgi:hypothetical protein